MIRNSSRLIIGVILFQTISVYTLHGFNRITFIFRRGSSTNPEANKTNHKNNKYYNTFAKIG